MSFNHFPFYGNHWEQAADSLERRIRQRQDQGQDEPEPEFPEAEVDDSIRRAAIIRERIRRFGR